MSVDTAFPLILLLLALWLFVRTRVAIAMHKQELQKDIQAKKDFIAELDNVLKLTDHEQCRVSTRRILANLTEHEPKGIIAFAWWDNGEITTHFSGGMDRMRVIGALEMAKIEIFKG